MLKRTLLFVAVYLSCTSAYGWQYAYDRTSVKITGYGTAGFIERDDAKPDFLGDWRLRGQFNYAVDAGETLALVYSIDQQALDKNLFYREIFSLFEDRNYGRLEFGFTDSIARKLGIGIPDVGGMRINDSPLFYQKIRPDGAVISDTTLTTGRDSLRLNLASVPTSFAQYGLSVSGLTGDYDYAIDAGIKFRQPSGKTKTAVSIGTSFMSRPKHYRTDIYTPYTDADWRAQISGGVNLQYNSFVWGLSARAIYDSGIRGTATDGLVVGTGLSYDILNYSLSVSYLFSDTGIWHPDARDYKDNTVLASFRYKYSSNLDGWLSIGLTTNTPFLSANLRLTF